MVAMRSPCWLFGVRSLTGTLAVEKEVQGRPCQCDLCLQSISCDVWEEQGSALLPVLCTTSMP